jgi:hypothetical protein
MRDKLRFNTYSNLRYRRGTEKANSRVSKSSDGTNVEKVPENKGVKTTTN